MTSSRTSHDRDAHDVDPADLGATGGEYGPSGAAHGVQHPSLAEVEAMTPEEALVAAAHEVCPYSNATRGNIPVDFTVTGGVA